MAHQRAILFDGALEHTAPENKLRDDGQALLPKH